MDKMWPFLCLDYSYAICDENVGLVALDIAESLQIFVGLAICLHTNKAPRRCPGFMIYNHISLFVSF